MENYLPLARRTNVLVQQVDGETLVYDLKVNKALCLNETSFAVWQNCDGVNSIKDIANELEKKFGHKVDEELISFAVSQLSKENLLESDSASNQFSGVSRRDVIRRIGFGSMIALPIIASITAPMAINAQSCPSPEGTVGNLGRCTQDCECCCGFTCNPCSVNGVDDGSRCNGQISNAG